MRLRSYTHLRGSFLFYIFLRALHRNAGNLLPALLLRTETRKKYPCSDEAAGHINGQEFSCEKYTQQTAEAANENEADKSLSRIRS